MGYSAACCDVKGIVRLNQLEPGRRNSWLRWMRYPFRYFTSSSEVIRLGVKMYIRCPLSLRHIARLSDSALPSQFAFQLLVATCRSLDFYRGVGEVKFDMICRLTAPIDRCIDHCVLLQHAPQSHMNSLSYNCRIMRDGST